MEPTKTPYIRDIKPPAAAPSSPPAAVEQPGKTEVVANVPVKAEASEPAANNPIADHSVIPVVQPAEADQEFDQILKDVNHDVKEQSVPPADKKLKLSIKKDQKLQSGPQTPKTRHTLPIAVAVVVALILVFIAFSAFKKPGGT